MAANKCGSRPQDHGEQEHGERSDQERKVQQAIFVPRRLKQDDRGEIEGEDLISGSASKSSMVLIVDVTVQERADLRQFLRLSIQILQSADADRAIGVHRNFRLADKAEGFEERVFGAAAGNVSAGYGTCILSSSCRFCARWRFVGEIAVEEFVPYSLAGADFTFARAVIRNEEVHTGIEHQVHIAVEVLRVAAVPDDALTVATFFIKTESHTIYVGPYRVLSRVHELCGFRLQNLG